MEISAYGKGYAVFGNTQPFKEDLKALGGRYNRNLGGKPGWVFGTNKLQELTEFVTAANSGESITESITTLSPSIPRPSTTSATTVTSGNQSVPRTVHQIRTKPVTIPTTVNYPNIFMGADNKQYQILMYTVNYPVVGDNIVVNFEQGAMPCSVETVLANDHIVLRNIRDDDTFEAKIVCGKWQLVGITEVHSMTF